MGDGITNILTIVQVIMIGIIVICLVLSMVCY